MFLLFCTSAIVYITWEEGYVLGWGVYGVGCGCFGWMEFLRAWVFGLAHGLSDQHVGLDS